MIGRIGAWEGRCGASGSALPERHLSASSEIRRCTSSVRFRTTQKSRLVKSKCVPALAVVHRPFYIRRTHLEHVSRRWRIGMDHDNLLKVGGTNQMRRSPRTGTSSGNTLVTGNAIASKFEGNCSVIDLLSDSHSRRREKHGDQSGIQKTGCLVHSNPPGKR